MPTRILRGDLIEWNVNRSGVGELAVREADLKVTRCSVTRDTYMARQSLRLAAAGVRAGDSVEIETDLRLGHCITKSLHIKQPEIVKRSFAATSISTLNAANPKFRPLNDTFWTRGNIAISGIVQRLDSEKLVLRTRSQGVFTLVVRRDTVFTTEGQIAEASDVKLQQRVYLRVARGITGELELHHVIWGEILNPRAVR